MQVLCCDGWQPAVICADHVEVNCAICGKHNRPRKEIFPVKQVIITSSIEAEGV